MKKLIISFAIIVLIVIAVLYLKNMTIEQHNRPANVPNEAQWVGGADGGDWIDCRIVDKGMLSCSIYTEKSGALIETSQFKGVVDNAELQFDYYDGTKIVTLSGLTFKKVNN